MKRYTETELDKIVRIGCDKIDMAVEAVIERLDMKFESPKAAAWEDMRKAMVAIDFGARPSTTSIFTNNRNFINEFEFTRNAGMSKAFQDSLTYGLGAIKVSHVPFMDISSV